MILSDATGRNIILHALEEPKAKEKKNLGKVEKLFLGFLLFNYLLLITEKG